MNVRPLLSVLVTLSGVSAARTAAAVCMGLEAQEYRVSIDGNSVSILPTKLPAAEVWRSGWPSPPERGDGRRGEDSRAGGGHVRTGYCGGDGYVDECVPPGKYRYGLAKPYDLLSHLLHHPVLR